MKRFFTVVLIVSTVVMLHLAVRTAPSHSLDQQSLSVVNSHTSTIQISQQDGYVAENGKSGWTILTRKYKPRSTQPISCLEILSLQECGTVNYDPDWSLMHVHRQLIERSRLIVPSLKLEQSVTSVERTLFAPGKENRSFNKA